MGNERLLVAFTHTPFSEELIRIGARLALTTHAPWLAVYVDNGKKLEDEESEILAKNIELARTLGAEVIIVQDPDIAAGIHVIAEQKKVTQIVIGKSEKTRFRSFLHPSPLQKLTKITHVEDIHIIRESSHRKPKKIGVKKIIPSKFLLSYLLILLWVVGIAYLCSHLDPIIGYELVGVIFLLSIVVFSFFFGRGPLLFATILYLHIWDYFFIPPKRSFALISTGDVAFLLLFFIAAIITGILSSRLRERHELLIKREKSTRALYEIVREISFARTREQLIDVVKSHLNSTLHGSSEVLFKEDSTLHFGDITDEKERAVALWVYENGREAGFSTSNLSTVKNIYFPLKAIENSVGVLAFRPNLPVRLQADETQFLYFVAEILANHLERYS